MLTILHRGFRIIVNTARLGSGFRNLHLSIITGREPVSRYTNRAVAIVTKEVRRHQHRIKHNRTQLAVNFSFDSSSTTTEFVEVATTARFSVDSRPDIITNHTNMEAKFKAMLPEFINLLCDLGQNEDSGMQSSFTWVRNILEHNLGGGKCTRGLTVIQSFSLLCGGEGSHISDHQLRQALILGWCVELMQAFFLMADDLMDQSLLRRGQTCWYKMPGVGLAAVNDSILMENMLYQLVRHEFSDTPEYIHIVETLQKTVYKTILGQCLDLNPGQHESVHNLSSFTDDRYNALVRYKTAYYSFYLPVGLALHLAGIHEKPRHEKAKEILFSLGQLFQVQDDYLDCYGDPSVTGKIGVDIQDDKCSWLILNAIKICSDKQRKILEENYGKPEESNISAVKNVYKELDMPGVFSKYEEKSFQELLKSIEETNDCLKELFSSLLNKIYKRQK